MLETVRDSRNCLVVPVDLVANVCCRWLHCHLWVEFEAKVSEFFGFVEWQWVGGVVKRESCCQSEDWWLLGCSLRQWVIKDNNLCSFIVYFHMVALTTWLTRINHVLELCGWSYYETHVIHVEESSNPIEIVYVCDVRKLQSWEFGTKFIILECQN